MSDVGFGHRSRDDCLFEEPAEDDTAAATGAPVDLEGELLQVGLPMDSGEAGA